MGRQRFAGCPDIVSEQVFEMARRYNTVPRCGLVEQDPNPRLLSLRWHFIRHAGRQPRQAREPTTRFRPVLPLQRGVDRGVVDGLAVLMDAADGREYRSEEHTSELQSLRHL